MRLSVILCVLLFSGSMAMASPPPESLGPHGGRLKVSNSKKVIVEYIAGLTEFTFYIYDHDMKLLRPDRDIKTMHTYYDIKDPDPSTPRRRRLRLSHIQNQEGYTAKLSLGRSKQYTVTIRIFAANQKEEIPIEVDLREAKQ